MELCRAFQGFARREKRPAASREEKPRLTLRALKNVRFDEAAPPPKGPAMDAGAPDDAAGEEVGGQDPDILLKAALEERLKTDADLVSRRLMQLRLAEHGRNTTHIQELTAERQALRRLSWRTSYAGLTAEERRLLQQVAAEARRDREAVLWRRSRPSPRLGEP